MTIEKTISGAWRISEVVNGYLFSMVYMGYTKKEAIKAFNEEKHNPYTKYFIA